MSISKGKIVHEETYKKGITYDIPALQELLETSKVEAHVKKRGKLETGVEYLEVRIYVEPK